MFPKISLKLNSQLGKDFSNLISNPPGEGLKGGLSDGKEGKSGSRARSDVQGKQDWLQLLTWALGNCSDNPVLGWKPRIISSEIGFLQLVHYISNNFSLWSSGFDQKIPKWNWKVLCSTSDWCFLALSHCGASRVMHSWSQDSGSSLS